MVNCFVIRCLFWYYITNLSSFQHVRVITNCNFDLVSRMKAIYWYNPCEVPQNLFNLLRSRCNCINEWYSPDRRVATFKEHRLSYYFIAYRFKNLNAVTKGRFILNNDTNFFLKDVHTDFLDSFLIRKGFFDFGFTIGTVNPWQLKAVHKILAIGVHPNNAYLYKVIYIEYSQSFLLSKSSLTQLWSLWLNYGWNRSFFPPTVFEWHLSLAKSLLFWQDHHYLNPFFYSTFKCFS